MLSAEIAARRGGSKRVTASIESLGDSERIAQAESKRQIEAAVKQINMKIIDVDTKVGRGLAYHQTCLLTCSLTLWFLFFTYLLAHLPTHHTITCSKHCS